MKQTSMIHILFTFLFGVALSASGCSNTTETPFCCSFDQRQCGGDEWAALLSQHSSWEKRIAALKGYLEEKGIAIRDISVNPDFYDGVCEACIVCPEVHRFFITTDEESKGKLTHLDLLNFKEEACQ